MRLLTAAGNGNGVTTEFNTGGKRHDNLRSIYCFGTFDGATVTVEVSPDNGTTWFAIDLVSFTAKGSMNMEARATDIRGVVAGGGGSEAINLIVH